MTGVADPAVAPAAELLPPPFAVISGAQVQQVLSGREPEIVALVEETYRRHGAGRSGNRG